MKIKCPNCNSTDVSIEDVIDTDRGEDVLIERLACACNEEDCEGNDGFEAELIFDLEIREIKSY